MKKILIDGSFVAKKVTGVQRFNWCVLNELVKFNDIEWYIAISLDTNIHLLDGIKNIKIIQKGKKNDKYWQFFTLAHIAKKIKAQTLCMSNFSPLFKKDFVVLHDVTAFDKQGNNDKIWAILNKMFIKFRFYKHKHIFTVSNFSKERIEYHFNKLDNNKVSVCYSGGNHWDKYENVKPKNFDDSKYFLSVGSTTNNKNFKYVVKLAERYSNLNFKIVGRVDDGVKQYLEKLKNVSFCGYLTNEELKYCYENAEAFILPSTYEGFGLPPLEAVYCGCKCLCLSNIQVFKEIYQNSANYFDPLDYNNLIDLNNLKQMSIDEHDRLINTFTWANVSKHIHDVIVKE